MARKVYCYVDETGQDTRGDFFIVGVVLTGEDKEQMVQACERIEEATGKRRAKWIKTRKAIRWRFMEEILRTPVFRGRLFVVRFEGVQDYVGATIEALARVLAEHDWEDKRLIVLIDALPRSHVWRVSHVLRKQGFPVRKVRGVRREEGDPLTRLADALCGLARAAYQGQEKAEGLWQEGIRKGIIRDLTS